MRKAIKKAAAYISQENQYTKDEEEQVEYALRIFIFEALKILGIITAFSIFGYSIEAIIAVVVMVSIKPYIGGYHEDNQIKCFIAAFSIVAAVVYLGTSVNLDFTAKLILNGITVYCIWQQAPVLNPQMPITRVELINRNRTIGVIVAIVFSLISIVFYYKGILSNTILWMLMFQTLLMFNKRNI